ncbi:hypothetical protein AAZV13_20G044900 [Glycine max]
MVWPSTTPEYFLTTPLSFFPRCHSTLFLSFFFSLSAHKPWLCWWRKPHKCDVDSTILACIAFSCPNLAFLEISVSDPAVNRISSSSYLPFSFIESN